jgi:hypothetical protein
MEILIEALIEFKDYYIKNKKKTEENIKERLSIINESSSINVNYCIKYYNNLSGNLFPANKGGGFFTKIQIQPIIIDLIAKLKLIIIQQQLINQNINEMNPIFEQQNETNIKLKTFELLTLCKTYITELQNLNIKIYEKKKYEKLDEDYSNNLLKLTINNINNSLTKSVKLPRATQATSRATRTPSRAPQATSRATRTPSRAPQAASRAPQAETHAQSRSSSFSSSKKYDQDDLKELAAIEELLRKEEEEMGIRGGRIRRVKKENKKINEKVVKKKITTNKIKRKYLVKK